VQAGEYGQSVGRVVSLAGAEGLEVDAQSINEAEWVSPSVAHQPLVNRVKACRVEVLK
jgi:hypothetical protein